TDQNGAEKIPSTRTLRFARPSEMNDPFDVYIEDLLGMDLEEVHERNIDVLFDRLLTDPRYFERLDLRNLENTLRIIRNASDDERIRLKQALKSIDLTALDPEYKALRDQQPALRDRFAHYLRNCGIFCATRTFSNLLMW